jgi:hypothetical protein
MLLPVSKRVRVLVFASDLTHLVGDYLDGVLFQVLSIVRGVSEE